MQINNLRYLQAQMVVRLGYNGERQDADFIYGYYHRISHFTFSIQTEVVTKTDMI